jgi:hypothetical protein
MTTLMRLGWGQDYPAFRQMFTGLFIPGGTHEQADFFNELQRRATSPDCAARYSDAAGDIDVTDLPRRVAVPTLVMHVRGDLVVPLEAGPKTDPFSGIASPCGAHRMLTAHLGGGGRGVSIPRRRVP